MTVYAAGIVLPDNAQTYQFYSTLKNTSGGLGVTAAVLVERDAAGGLRVTEGGDTTAGAGTFGGSLIGMLVGVLAGPLGVLLGATAGALGGSLFDLSRLEKADDAISEFGRLVPAGGNAIIAETNEADTAALDAMVTAAGGTIARRPMHEVVAELEAQQQAAEDASDAARKAMREQRKAERHEKVEDRVDALKAKFEHAKND